MLKTLIFVKNSELTILSSVDQVPEGCAFASVDQSCSVYLMVRGIVDLDGEIEKLEKKAEKQKFFRDQLAKKLSLPEYTSKVRADVQEQDKAKVRDSVT